MFKLLSYSVIVYIYIYFFDNATESLCVAIIFSIMQTLFSRCMLFLVYIQSNKAGHLMHLKHGIRCI